MVLHEVIIKMPLGRERFRAFDSTAMIRFFACVQPQMRLQVSLFIESFLTVVKRAHEVLRAIMPLKVDF